MSNTKSVQLMLLTKSQRGGAALLSRIVLLLSQKQCHSWTNHLIISVYTIIMLEMSDIIECCQSIWWTSSTAGTRFLFQYFGLASPVFYILYFCISVSAESVCSWSWSIWVWLDPSDGEAVLINYFPAQQLSTTAAHKLWLAFRNAGMPNRNVFVFVYLFVLSYFTFQPGVLEFPEIMFASSRAEMQ